MNADLLLDTTKDDLPHLSEPNKVLPLKPARRAALRVFMTIGQGMKCHYCRCGLRLERGPSECRQPHNLATFEHLIDEWSSPTGKDDRVENIVIACHGCNSKRNQHRLKEVAKFYESKFPTKALYTHFAKVAKPAEFIAMFGICPDTWKP